MPAFHGTTIGDGVVVKTPSTIGDDGDLMISKGDGTTQFADSAAAGLVEEAPSDGNQYARKDAGWEIVAAAGGDGTYNEVLDTGVSASVGRAKLDFRATGDASVSVVDVPGEDRTQITIDATAGVAPGGISKGTRFVATEIMVAETVAGDGTAKTLDGITEAVLQNLADNGVTSTADTTNDVLQIGDAGTRAIKNSAITATALQAHFDDATIHFTEASIDHTAIQNIGTNTHAQIDSHIADGSIHLTNPMTTPQDMIVGGVGGAQGRLPVGTNGQYLSVVAGNVEWNTITESDISDLQPYLLNVIEDTTPQLGGSLEVAKDLWIQFFSSTPSIVGGIGTIAADNGIAVFRNTSGVYDPADGAVVMLPGLVELHGTVANVQSLASAGARQVYCTADGNLYAVDPPETGWQETDTSNFDTSFGSGSTLGPWVEVTGLEITVPVTIEAGDRFDLTVSLYTENTASNFAGTLNIGFGQGGGQPAAVSASRNVSPDTLTMVTESFSTIAASQIPAGTILTVWAQRGVSSSNGNLHLRGTTRVHEMIASVPAEGGGGGGVQPGDDVVWTGDHTFDKPTITRLQAAATRSECVLLDLDDAATSRRFLRCEDDTGEDRLRIGRRGSVSMGIEASPTWASGISIDLAINYSNHLTISSTSAVAATVTFEPPDGAAAGTIILKRGATVGTITFAMTGGNVFTANEPDFADAGEANSTRIISWRYDPTGVGDLYLMFSPQFT